jgi:hypothetical protein
LILHGSVDWRASLETQALALVHQKAHQLIIYNADDHSLSFNRQESEQQIIKWFRSHFR